MATSKIVVLIEEHLSAGNALSTMNDNLIDHWVNQIRVEMQNAADFLTNAGSEKFTIRDFGATLLFVVVGKNQTIAFQLGDGVIVIDDPEETWCMALQPQRGPMHRPDRRRFTNFVTSDRYEEKRKINYIPRRVTKIALLTDGVEPAALDADDLPRLPGKFLGASEAFHEHAPYTDEHKPTLLGTYERIRHEFFNCAFEVIENDTVAGLSAAASKKFKDFLDSPAVLECSDDDKTLVLASYANN